MYFNKIRQFTCKKKYYILKHTLFRFIQFLVNHNLITFPKHNTEAFRNFFDHFHNLYRTMLHKIFVFEMFSLTTLIPYNISIQ